MSTLYIVSTPIGNLEDITFRAVRILKEVDSIVCEDTRVTRKVLDHYGIQKPLYILHERSSEKDLQNVIGKLSEGKNLAYVTDAGTPGIADPGGKLVSRIMEHISRKPPLASPPYQGEDKEGVKLRVTSYELQEVSVVPIPGPSSLTSAISICGFNMQEFSFFGFLPHKKGRQTKVKEIIASEIPVVLFESKYRFVKLFEELIEFGIQKDRQLMAANDLTKKFERVYRGTVDEVLQEIKKEGTKGEFVVIINHATHNS